jgi:hypothetical protein
MVNSFGVAHHCKDGEHFNIIWGVEKQRANGVRSGFADQFTVWNCAAEGASNVTPKAGRVKARVKASQKK